MERISKAGAAALAVVMAAPGTFMEQMPAVLAGFRPVSAKTVQPAGEPDEKEAENAGKKTEGIKEPAAKKTKKKAAKNKKKKASGQKSGKTEKAKKTAEKTKIYGRVRSCENDTLVILEMKKEDAGQADHTLQPGDMDMTTNIRTYKLTAATQLTAYQADADKQEAQADDPSPSVAYMTENAVIVSDPKKEGTDQNGAYYTEIDPDELEPGDIICLEADEKDRAESVRRIGSIGAPDPGIKEDAAVIYSGGISDKDQKIYTGLQEQTALLIRKGTVAIMERFSIEKTDKQTKSAVEAGEQTAEGSAAAAGHGSGAAVAIYGGQSTFDDSKISSQAPDAPGLYGAGDAVVRLTDSRITTAFDGAPGLQAESQAAFYLGDTDIYTKGTSSPAIAADGDGIHTYAEGGTFKTAGKKSYVVDSSGDHVFRQASLWAKKGPAVRLHGNGELRLDDSVLAADVQDKDEAAQKAAVVFYQETPVDQPSEGKKAGKTSFEMHGGQLITTHGSLFYATNTDADILLDHVDATLAEDAGYLLKAAGNHGKTGRGMPGDNGAGCRFTMMRQRICGKMIWDDASQIEVCLRKASRWTGSVERSEKTGEGAGPGKAVLQIGKGSVWIITADSRVSELHNDGSIRDEKGRTVTIRSPKGKVFVKGDSNITITTDVYDTDADMSRAVAAAMDTEQ